jgi:DNA-binding protein H-NS
MPKPLTYDELTRRIQALEAERDKARQREVADVVAKIKVAIEHYGITAEQLGLAASKSSPKAAKPRVGKARRAPKAVANGSGPRYKTAVRYADGNGNGWSGFGPKPKWFKDALAAGRSEAELRVAAA